MWTQSVLYPLDGNVCTILLCCTQIRKKRFRTSTRTSTRTKKGNCEQFSTSFLFWKLHVCKEKKRACKRKKFSWGGICYRNSTCILPVSLQNITKVLLFFLLKKYWAFGIHTSTLGKARLTFVNVSFACPKPYLVIFDLRFSSFENTRKTFAKIQCANARRNHECGESSFAHTLFVDIMAVILPSPHSTETL